MSWFTKRRKFVPDYMDQPCAIMTEHGMVHNQCVLRTYGNGLKSVQWEGYWYGVKNNGTFTNSSWVWWTTHKEV